jgi:hypothetical protein
MPVRSICSLTLFPRACFPPDHPLRLIGHRKRAAVWDACGGCCTSCGVALHPFRTFSIDHVIPRAHRGTNALEHLVGACTMCNERKADALPADADEPLTASCVCRPRRGRCGGSLTTHRGGSRTPHHR